MVSILPSRFSTCNCVWAPQSSVSFATKGKFARVVFEPSILFVKIFLDSIWIFNTIWDSSIETLEIWRMNYLYSNVFDDEVK